MERIKRNSYCRFYGNTYFWRTYDGEEVDFIEEQDSQLWAFEAKWSATKKARAPKAWSQTYPESSFAIINPENYFQYIL